MINEQLKRVFDLLMNDHFLYPRKSATGKMRYGVYDQKRNVLFTISDRQYRHIRNILTRKNEKIVLSRKMIRSMHGNNYFKKTYLTQYDERKRNAE